MRPALALLLSVSLMTWAAAQAPTLSGAWIVNAKGGSGSSPDGASWNMNPVNGTLTLEHKSSEITGTWKGQMPEPWALTGRGDNRGFELHTEWRDIGVTRDGTKTTERARWVFRGSAADGTMSGTLGLDIENRGERAQPFTAKRTP